MNISPREIATILAALEYWKEELAAGNDDWIPESLFFAKHSPLSEMEIGQLAARLEADCLPNAIGQESPSCVAERYTELLLDVPTYNYQLYPSYVSKGVKPEFGEPIAQVVVRNAEGVRVVLGTHNYDETDRPDVQIERHPNGWMIFLHPLGGSDACAYVYFVDDGRSYFLPEFGYGPTPRIRILQSGARLPEFDGAK